MLPRSFLYVPANQPALVEKSGRSLADAVVLDLEDAVPVAEKATAREVVRACLQIHPAAGSPELWVRVSPAALAEDLDCAVWPGLAGLFLASATPAALADLAERLAPLAESRRPGESAVGVVALIESAEGLLGLSAMAASPCLTAFGIGEVDLLADLRMRRSVRTAEAIIQLRTQVVVHSAAARLAPPVAPTSVDFRDLDAFAETTHLLADQGFRSRTAIHPAQIPVIHQALTPSRAEVEEAEDILRRSQDVGGGVTADAKGRLIDAAVVRGAYETVQRAPSMYCSYQRNCDPLSYTTLRQGAIPAAMSSCPHSWPNAARPWFAVTCFLSAHGSHRMQTLEDFGSRSTSRTGPAASIPTVRMR